MEATLPSGATIDLCDVPYGGGPCQVDEHCHQGGLCLQGQCVCFDRWACKYCTMDVSQDILLGATCGEYVTGGGECLTNAECTAPFGQCVEGKCQCLAGYTCGHCQYLKEAIMSGDVSCPCDDSQCSGHGRCVGSNCVCDAGFAGPDCSFDPCEGVYCSGHGECDRDVGGCVCDDGFEGEDCALGGGGCDVDTDCTFFGHTPDGAVATGGVCVEEACECYDGYLCSNCAGKLDPDRGPTCANAQGGAPCNSNIDCGWYPDRQGTGGVCLEQTGGSWQDEKYWQSGGVCQCFQGFTCPGCNVVAEWMAPGEECPPPPIVQFGAGHSAGAGASLPAALILGACVALATARPDGL